MIMRHILRHARTAAAFLFTLALAGNAFAWGFKGHQIIATIAAQHLDPETSKTANLILAGHSLVDVCTWADQARNQDAYRFTGPYHYVDIPRGATSIDLERDGKNGCVILAIQKYGKIIADDKASKRDRLDALRFVIHFVGDLHCPMHTSYSDDKGGNGTMINFGGNQANLHATWDSGILETRKLDLPHYVADLLGQHQSGALKDDFLLLDKKDVYNSPVLWADETLKIMLANCYQFKEGEDLSLAYTERGIPIINNQLYHGGIRLAAFLNATLKPSPNDSAPAADTKSTTATMTTAAPAIATTASAK